MIKNTIMKPGTINHLKQSDKIARLDLALRTMKNLQMKRLLIFLFIIPAFCFAQEKGIHFVHNSSWAEIQAKAKAENKYIFMDCFTTWCGPCKFMSNNIFPLEQVGNFFNDKFIAIKVQLDTTASDNDEVKSWYQSGHDIANKYEVRAYPTYLFFNPQGEIVHRAVGSSDAEAFLTKVKNALDTNTQYYTQLRAYKNGRKDPASLYALSLAALDAYDMSTASAVGNEYLATQSDLYTKENLKLLSNFTNSSNDKGFSIMLKNPEKVDAVLGKNVAESIVQRIIMREEIFTHFSNDASKKIDWDAIEQNLTKKYPAQASEALAQAKVIWYQYIKDWNNYQMAIVNYVKKYGADLNAGQLNDYAWSVFENCGDIKCVEEALEWSKRSLTGENSNNPMFMDTYANILYRLGKKDEALTWEQKAVDLAPEGDKKQYQETLDKIKNGEKTWN